MTSNALSTETSFGELGVEHDLVDLLAGQGIEEPFPIQAQAIPDILAGRDVCGEAKTGSGKTLAFGLPIVQQLRRGAAKRPRALVLVPTRELANQVSEVLAPLAAARGYGLVAVYGGVKLGGQIDTLRDGVEIVVATPGRLIDLLDRGSLRLDDVDIVAIDEADQMADMGFLPQVRAIMRRVPAEHQTLLFSATLGGPVATLVKDYMDDPIRHEADPGDEGVENMEHRFLKVHQMDKVKVAAAIARNATRTLLFVRTRVACDAVARKLRNEGVDARPIHGDLPQRTRETALAGFASGKTAALVATNVAARGLDIDEVDIVVHYDPPDDPNTYLHRSGRTARAGESGLVVTLVEWDQVNEVIAIQRRAGLNVPIVKMFSNDERLTDLTSWEPDPEFAPFAGSERRGAPRRRRR